MMPQNKKIKRLPNMLLYRTHNSSSGTYCPSHVKNDEGKKNLELQNGLFDLFLIVLELV
jgi:hypothetical protein